ncbi:MAG: hypothetical protein IH993_09385 [Proteobacteria bacterium]|nr:hypothetical protein [Pseudomonadota bacterium]
MPSRETWDTVIKAGSAITAISTVAISAFVFLTQRVQSIQDFERETKRPFIEQQFKLYGEAVAVASRLARAAEQGQRPPPEEDLQRFWELYWGPLAMVEDFRVELAMVVFGRSLEDYAGGISTECSRMLNKASLALAHRARQSLEEQWGVELVTSENIERQDKEFEDLLDACGEDRDRSSENRNMK